MLHGEPSWSYLYRRMIPLFAAAGHRAVAPDLVGFGKSDKPGNREDYSYQRHLDWLRGWLDAVDLRDITLICQDWGSLLGLRLVAEQPDRFARVVLTNGGLPTGDGEIIQGGCKTELDAAVLAAYEAPFPDERYKAGARAFPTLVPVRPDDPAAGPNRTAWRSLMRFDRPFLTAFSDGDPITAGGDAPFRRLVRGAQGQPHTTIEGAGHFVQEDKGEELAQVVLAWMRKFNADDADQVD
jgi:haloalkane dehalogenase